MSSNLVILVPSVITCGTLALDNNFLCNPWPICVPALDPMNPMYVLPRFWRLASLQECGARSLELSRACEVWTLPLQTLAWLLREGAHARRQESQ